MKYIFKKDFINASVIEYTKIFSYIIFEVYWFLFDSFKNWKLSTYNKEKDSDTHTSLTTHVAISS